MKPTILQEIDFDLSELFAKHPPHWRHSHKVAIYDLVRRSGAAPSWKTRYTRWKLAPLFNKMPIHQVEIEARDGFFTYPKSGTGVWHLNFADSRLFAAYGSALMAQDEWQVLEHPALGSIREALLAEERPALTRADGISTPVLISSVPRQCAVDLTGGDAAPSGQPLLQGVLKRLSAPKRRKTLYGNAFSSASQEEVLRASVALNPPPLSNILAIAAPTGSGVYTVREIADVLQTAYSGFAAAVLESTRTGVGKDSIEINTGWWGCGAFGGNRVLMAALQILAAKLAGIGSLRFYIGDSRDRCIFDDALALQEELLAEHGDDVMSMIQALGRMEFSWGVSDGN